MKNPARYATLWPWMIRFFFAMDVTAAFTFHASTSNISQEGDTGSVPIVLRSNRSHPFFLHSHLKFLLANTWVSSPALALAPLDSGGRMQEHGVVPGETRAIG